MGKAKNYKTQIGLAVLVCMNGGSSAFAQNLASLPQRTVPAIEAGEARPVAAWYKFCERHPEDCVINPREEAVISINQKQWMMLQDINSTVNASIKPLTDDEHWGVIDRWTYPDDGKGDCEDYQLLKRKKLVEAGFSKRAMPMTVVIDEKGEGHAVLMIRTDRGDFILDNKTDKIMHWHETGYVFVKREGQDNDRWVSLGGAISPSMTANK